MTITLACVVRAFLFLKLPSYSSISLYCIMLEYNSIYMYIMCIYLYIRINVVIHNFSFHFIRIRCVCEKSEENLGPE